MNTFRDADGDALLYSARLADGSALPAHRFYVLPITKARDVGFRLVKIAP
ncbi:MAG: hypothetical protein HQL91_09800 [Magnetococcales bacterium]|nr:hypothetical protein [Magnetococcales bacterium]